MMPSRPDKFSPNKNSLVPSYPKYLPLGSLSAVRYRVIPTCGIPLFYQFLSNRPTPNFSFKSQDLFPPCVRCSTLFGYSPPTVCLCLFLCLSLCNHRPPRHILRLFPIFLVILLMDWFPPSPVVLAQSLSPSKTPLLPSQFPFFSLFFEIP